MPPDYFDEIVEKAKQHPEYMMTGVRIEFMENVAKEMRERSITLSEVADRMKLPVPYVRKVIACETETNILQDIITISKALGKEISIEFK